MSVTTTTRPATPDEIAAEMDRRGVVIERIEVERDALRAQHDRRVAELLAANNAEVERRRRAEAETIRLIEQIQGTIWFLVHCGIDQVKLEKLRADLYVAEQTIAQLRAAATAAPTAAEPAARPTHRHRKRGTTYVELARAQLQSGLPALEGDTLVVYRGQDGRIWCRPDSEFDDGGRFERLDAAPLSKPEERLAATPAERGP